MDLPTEPVALLNGLATRIYKAPFATRWADRRCLPEVARNVRVLIDFDTELHMNGLGGLVENSIGDLSPEIIAALEAIGARATADALRDVQTVMASREITHAMLRGDFAGCHELVSVGVPAGVLPKASGPAWLPRFAPDGSGAHAGAEVGLYTVAVHGGMDLLVSTDGSLAVGPSAGAARRHRAQPGFAVYLTRVWRAADPRDDDEIVRMCIAFNAEDPGPDPVPEAHMRRTLQALRREPRRGRVVVLELDAHVCGYALLVSVWSNELGGETCVIDYGPGNGEVDRSPPLEARPSARLFRDPPRPPCARAEGVGPHPGPLP